MTALRRVRGLHFAGSPQPRAGRIRYDNSTKARTLARHATRDGINWEARYLWVPEVSDPNLHNYGFRVRKSGDSYLGFFPRYNVRTQHLDLQIWVSRNGIHWEQPGGEQAWLATARRDRSIGASSTCRPAGTGRADEPGFSITGPTTSTSTPGFARSSRAVQRHGGEGRTRSRFRRDFRGTSLSGAALDQRLLLVPDALRLELETGNSWHGRRCQNPLLGGSDRQYRRDARVVPFQKPRLPDLARSGRIPDQRFRLPESRPRYRES